MRKSSHSENSESATQNQTETPVIKPSVQLRPDGDRLIPGLRLLTQAKSTQIGTKIRISLKNNFFTENLNFYRRRYARLFQFGEQDTIPRSLHNDIGVDSRFCFHQSWGEDRSNYLREGCWTQSDPVPYFSICSVPSFVCLEKARFQPSDTHPRILNSEKWNGVS